MAEALSLREVTDLVCYDVAASKVAMQEVLARFDQFGSARQLRSISRSLSLVNTGGNAGLRGLVVEPTACKTARFRVAQTGPYGSTETIYTC